MFWQNIHHLDQQITLAINSWNSALTDPFWAFMSMKLVWVPLYAAILALIIWKLGWKRGGILILCILATFGLCDQFSNVIKYAVARIRPLNDEYMISHGLHVLERGGGFSFFSAHAANSFGLAACSWSGLKKGLSGSSNPTDTKIVKWYGWFMFSWASLVGISRIFVGKHYLGDVIVGTLVGLTFGLIMSWISKKVITKL